MKKESDISNTVLQSASSSVIIESNEESSKPQSMKYKKRFFSSIKLLFASMVVPKSQAFLFALHHPSCS